MRKNPIRLVKFFIGSSLALIALTNCFNVLSSSSTVTAVPRGTPPRIEQLKQNQHPLSFQSPGAANSAGNLLEFGREGDLFSLRGLAKRTSAVRPFAPGITATKSHMLPPGDTQADPGDTLTYTVVITNSGTTDATGVNFSDTIDPNTTLVPGSLAVSPIAVDDSYHTIGNVNISVPVGQGVIANDLNPNGSGTLVVTKVNATGVPGGGSTTTSTTNGSVTMSSDGSFTYNPNVAFRGPSDSFTYTLANGTGKTDTATVTIAVNGLIWFVNAAAAPGGDGRLSSPFNCLVGSGCFDPVAADIANDNIFVYSGAYLGGLTLLSGQKLIGQGAGDTLLNITGLAAPSGTNMLPSTGGANPTIASASANITLGSGNTIRGVTLGGSAAAGVDLAGTGFGTVTIAEVTLAGTGQALNLINGTLSGPVASTAAFTKISSLLSATTGISLTSVAGKMSAGSTSVSSPAGVGISINTSSGSLNFGSTTSTLSGSSGVSLTGNTGLITFADLNISPNVNQKGLLATDNSNTITATGGAITTTGAAAVEITRSSGTSPLAMSVTSVSAVGGTNGIFLSNTSGSFTVSGAGTGGSGGTISNMTGADGTTNGIGIYLNNTTNITLAYMNLTDFQNYGIRGLAVSGFSMDNCSVNVSSFTTNGTSAAFDEASVSFGARSGANGLTGTASITNSTIRRGFEDNLSIFNFSGTLNLTIDSCTIRDTNPAGGNDGVIVEAHSTANISVDVKNSQFIANGGDHFQATCDDNGILDVKFGRNGANSLMGGHPTAVGQSITINSGSFSGQVTFNVSNNSINGAVDTPININKGGGTGTFDGRIQNNAIGTTGIANSGTVGNKDAIRLISNGAGSFTAAVTNNVLKQVSGNGIFGVGRSGSSTYHVTITGNNLSEPAPGVNAIRVESGASSSDTVQACGDIGGAGALANTVNGDWGAGIGADEIRVRHQFSTTCTFRLPGFGGGGTSAVVTYLTGRNNVVGGTISATIAGSGAYTGGAACTQPTTMSLAPDEFAISAASTATDEQITDRNRDSFLWADRGEGPHDENDQKLKPEELAWMVQSALTRWAGTEISAEDLARLQAVHFEVADLPNSELAVLAGDTVKIDELAAGYGWFFDQSPLEDSEFPVPVPNKELQTTDLSQAHGKMDLLTVVMRQLGQVYVQGKDRLPKKLRLNLQPLKEGTLLPGVRRLPLNQWHIAPTTTGSIKQSAHDRLMAKSSAAFQTDATRASSQSAQAQPQAGTTNVPAIARYAVFTTAIDHVANGDRVAARAIFNPSTDLMPRSFGETAKRMRYVASARPVAGFNPAPFSGETVTLSIGTIPAGKSVTIMFQVTINNPLPSGVCSLTNVGHVTGSNFSPVDTNTDVTTIANAVSIGACPANITTNTDSGACTAVVTYATPTGTGCPVPTVTCNPPSGFAFPKGTTTVTCTATNGNPPDATCTFTVTVKDAEAPTCNLPANITQNTDPGQCSAVVTYTATASDNCPGATIVCNPASGSTFQKGTTTVNCTASDTSPDSPDTNCSFTVTITDNQSPTIGACPDPVVTNTAPGQCSAVVNYVTPSGSDNCPGVTVACNPPTGTAFPKGVTTVTCTATDTSNHTASCFFTVTVIDNQPPSITCPGNINATEDSPGSGCATVNYPAPTVSDNCPGATFNCSPPPGTCFPIGTTTVTCTAMDTSGNNASCQFTVTVTALGLTALSPAKMWIGLKNSDDVGTKFDLLAEVLRNGMVVGSGQLDDVPGGSSGFNNAVLRTITLALSSAVPMGPGDTMSFRLSVRIAATSGHNSGTVRLWYNGAAIDSGASRDAGSRFDATVAGSTDDYFLRSPGFTLSTTAGSSRTFVDKLASNSGGNPWQVVGTWSKTF